MYIAVKPTLLFTCMCTFCYKHHMHVNMPCMWPLTCGVKQHLCNLRSATVLHSNSYTVSISMRAPTRKQQQRQGAAIAKSIRSKFTNICPNTLTLTITEWPLITVERLPKQLHLLPFILSNKLKAWNTAAQQV